jgi:hypothetical protein
MGKGEWGRGEGKGGAVDAWTGGKAGARGGEMGEVMLGN